MAKTESSQVVRNMALSLCSNLSSLQHLNSGFPSFPQLHHPGLEPLGLCGAASAFIDTCFDPLVDCSIEDFLYPNYLIPCFSCSPESFITNAPDIFPLNEFDNSPFPKRQKINELHSYCDPAADFLEDSIKSSLHFPELLPELAMPAPEFHLQEEYKYSNGCVGGELSEKKPGVAGASLSAQSMAARQRRRRITEKTLELGKLIPGGRKMNTAEMLQAAHKYVKYLQAQVGILELANGGSIQKSEEPMNNNKQELQILLESPKIQEKLYAEEKCLVTKDMVEALMKDPQLQSRDLIYKGMAQLMMCTKCPSLS